MPLMQAGHLGGRSQMRLGFDCLAGGTLWYLFLFAAFLLGASEPIPFVDFEA